MMGFEITPGTREQWTRVILGILSAEVIRSVFLVEGASHGTARVAALTTLAASYFIGKWAIPDRAGE